MPNTSSAKKMVRKIERRTAINKVRRTRMRNQVRKVEEAVASGDKAAAKAAFGAAEPEIMSAVSHGILKKNTGARKVSRLSKRVKLMGA